MSGGSAQPDIHRFSCKSTNYDTSTPHFIVENDNRPMSLYVSLSSGSEINMIRESVIDMFDCEVIIDQYASWCKNTQAYAHNIIGFTEFWMAYNGLQLWFEGLVVEELDVDVVAGMPFMEDNDIIVRPSKQLVTFCDGSTFHYGVQVTNTVDAPGEARFTRREDQKDCPTPSGSVDTLHSMEDGNLVSIMRSSLAEPALPSEGHISFSHDPNPLDYEIVTSQSVATDPVVSDAQLLSLHVVSSDYHAACEDVSSADTSSLPSAYDSCLPVFDGGTLIINTPIMTCQSPSHGIDSTPGSDIPVVSLELPAIDDHFSVDAIHGLSEDLPGNDHLRHITDLSYSNRSESTAIRSRHCSTRCANTDHPDGRSMPCDDGVHAPDPPIFIVGPESLDDHDGISRDDDNALHDTPTHSGLLCSITSAELLPLATLQVRPYVISQQPFPYPPYYGDAPPGHQPQFPLPAHGPRHSGHLLLGGPHGAIPAPG